MKRNRSFKAHRLIVSVDIFDIPRKQSVLLELGYEPAGEVCVSLVTNEYYQWWQFKNNRIGAPTDTEAK